MEHVVAGQIERLAGGQASWYEMWMRSFRTKGVVRLTDSIRMELTRGLSRCEKDALEVRVGQSLRRIDQILATHETVIEALPSPTRRAYAFLRGIDFDAIETSEAP